jgi:L,D-transpeptidase-like protein
MFHRSGMRSSCTGFVTIGVLIACLACANAAVVIHVDKNRQAMSVAVDGEPRYEWAVSTGRAGYGTPNGTYHPQRLERTWFSKKYYDSPMPHSIFFSRGFAIHGSYEIRHLGGPASHGCIRLHPSNAATLFALVQQEGIGNTNIVVSGSNPPGHREVQEVRARTHRYGSPGGWSGYNPYAGYGYGRWPNYYSGGWYGRPFGY